MAEAVQRLKNIRKRMQREQEKEIDKRSLTTHNKAYNYIGTGGPEMEVKGQGAVLPEKKRSSKAY